MGQAAYAVIGAVFAAAAMVSLGRIVLRSAKVECAAQEETPIAFFVGGAVLSLIVFALAAVHVAYKGVFIAIGALSICAATRIRATHADPLPPLPRIWKLIFWIPASVYFVLYFVNALAPEYSPDGTAYHLGLILRYARRHGFPAITTNMYANLSQGFGLLQWFAFSIGRHSAAALLHLACLCALAASILAYARRLGRPGAGVAAALFVFASPVIGMDATVAYNDVALAGTLFAVFHLLQINPRAAAPVGLLAGFAFAIKYTGFLAVPYALVESWRLSRRLRPAIVTAAFAALMIAPWLVKNTVVTGNPVSPFFNAYIPNPTIHVWFERDYSESLRKYPGLDDYRVLPLEVTTRGLVLGGFFGPLWLLAPAALLSLSTPAGRRLTFAAILFAATYAANVGTRFLIPASPFLALAMMLGVRAAAPFLAIAHVILSWPWITPTYAHPQAWRLAEFPWRAALRIEPEDQFLSRKSAGYVFARAIERHVPPDGRVFSFGQIAEAYTARDVRVGFQAASNEVARDIILSAIIPEWGPSGRYRFRFTRRPVEAIRIVQTERGTDMWSVSEVRVFDGDRELPRDPKWRLRARPNPWDVQLAFDNSPVTRWRAWDRLAAGQSIEIDLAGPRAVDSIALEFSRDQHQARVAAEVRSAGKWERLGPPEDHDESLPMGMRRAAMVELKYRGFTHLAVHDSDFGARDFLLNAVLWGITPLGEWYESRLYRID